MTSIFLPWGSVGGAPILTPRRTLGELVVDAAADSSEKVGYGFDVGVDESDTWPGRGDLWAHILPSARTRRMMAVVMECSISATPALLEWYNLLLSELASP